MCQPRGDRCLCRRSQNCRSGPILIGCGESLIKRAGGRRKAVVIAPDPHLDRPLAELQRRGVAEVNVAVEGARESVVRRSERGGAGRPWSAGLAGER